MRNYLIRKDDVGIFSLKHFSFFFLRNTGQGTGSTSARIGGILAPYIALLVSGVFGSDVCLSMHRPTICGRW